jgi:Domain of unknown function (DUF4440)
MFRLNSQARKASAAPAFISCLGVLLFIGCTQTAPDPRAADEKELRDLDAQWSKAAGARDLDAPVANTKQTIRDLWAPMMAPNMSVSWQLNQTEVARSGDLGYARGAYQLVMKDAAGKTTTERGKLLEVWKKQSDGKWKCVIDNFSADGPPASPAPENSK